MLKRYPVKIIDNVIVITKLRSARFKVVSPTMSFIAKL